MQKNKIALIAAVVFLAGFIAFSALSIKLKIDNQRLIVDKHASVVATALWNFDPDANKEYLMQVVQANDYKQIKVFSSYDDLFLHVQQGPGYNAFDSFLEKVKLIPNFEIRSDVIFNADKIGYIVVVWQPRFFYTYLNYFIVGLLVFALFYMWLSLLETNKSLDNTVKERTAELAKTKSYLNNVVNSMPSVLIGIEPDGTITELNQEAVDLLGLNATEAKGESLSNLLPQFGAYIDLVEECISKKEPIELNKEMLNVKGSNKIVDLVFYPLITNGVTGAVIRLDDVGLKVRFEEMMVQSEKMLSVGGLAAGMAHEINNPLGAILQGIQNIKRRMDPDFAKNIEIASNLDLDLSLLAKYLDERGIYSFLGGIQDAGERAAKIVANMLQFSRKSGSSKGSHDLQELIENTIELASNDYDLKKNFDFRHIEIVRDYAHKDTKVYGIRTEIEQVLLNLLKNAAHAVADKSDDGYVPRIKIKTVAKNQSTEIIVEDNGAGISESVRKRIFDPFFTTKPVGLGTGLGLSISYFIIVENHKGQIDIDSRQGQWTRVSISLPKI